ncbi:26S proteasome non ATPase regulatory subunit 1 [Trichuris trichiura]|uniref:26S proteasome non-ATPase regulatory subunit 1 n=1 Tax=Trichuris trichiura TaxID=36087 RepID=A0A077Z2N1_TRITR|nr:26S proteasome non ATPase regulatory subunit 1 [Trichuris trichiura]
MTAILSASGIIALLGEDSPKMKIYALRKLDRLVNIFWHEIANVIANIESLFEDRTFPERKLAALVASKIYFHLTAYDDALLFAIGAEELFDVDANSEYVNTVVARAIDTYALSRKEGAEPVPFLQEKKMASRLQDLINRIFEGCFARKEYKAIVGVAIETRRLDVLQRALDETDEKLELITYCIKAVIEFVQHRGFRNQVLVDMIKRLGSTKNSDYNGICQALKYLEDPECVAEILVHLISESDDAAAVAYQLALDIHDSSPQSFMKGIGKALQARLEGPNEDDDSKSKVASASDQEQKGPSTVSEPSQSVSESEEKTMSEEDENESRVKSHVAALNRIVRGDLQTELYLQFYMKNNHSDILILKTIKDYVRNSVCHSATVISNALMHHGTTSDEFLRTNLEWVSKASNWAKFTAVASLGVIHKGHEAEAMRVLENYLPKESASSSSGYLEAGGLYALGLIFSNRGSAEVISYLKKQMMASSNTVMRHGGCLGLGLATLGTHRWDVYDCLRGVLFYDDAVSGEAAALAMGLVMAGSNNSRSVRELIAYGMDTRHEKILRGICVGLGVIACGCLEEPEPWIKKLLKDKNPLLRRAGVYALAMAYCGTGNSTTAGRLLFISVEDVNDDVRRAAVSCLGFVMVKNPTSCAQLVSQLTESYNPHVRYGAAISLGIACAGTALPEAIYLLEPMLNDAVNFVRQGALIALGMVYMQHSEAMTPKVKDFRASLIKTICDKHEDSLAKFGAIIAHGILDAGGRNVTIGLLARMNYVSTTAAIGLLVFLQTWYWFPLSHFLSLAFQPTCLIGINTKLQMPQVDFISNSNPSLYAYPPPMEEKRTKQLEKLPAVVLSFKSKRRDREKQGKQEQENKTEKADDEPASVSEAISEPEAKKDDAEPNLKVMTMPEDCRYEPVKSLKSGGIIVLRDKEENKEEELVEIVKPVIDGEEANEPEPPEPFDYTE